MQKSHMNKINKQSFICALCAFIFLYGYCSTVTLGASAYQRAPMTNQEVNNQTRDILSNIFKPKNPVEINSTQSSVEIWTRVRARLHLGTTQTTQPLFQRHVKSFSQHQDYINKVIKNASPYFFYILEEVEKRGMPSEIALLPIIESDFNPNTLSHAGAVGLWQIMPTLGKMHGLKQNAWYDGRKDVYQSTKVALDHLEYLHKKFNGNWLLAIAAYNCGEVKLQRAIKQNRSAKKSTEFWALKLPKETTHFVPKLLALAAIIKSPKQYGVVLPAIPNKPVIARVHTGKPIDIAHAAKLVDISETQLRRLNPGFKKSMSANTPLHLVVPIHHAENFKEKINKTAPAKTAAPTTITATTTKAAKSSTAQAKATTKTSNSDVTVVSSSKTTSKSNKASGKTHTVKRGESIPSISKKYKVKISTIVANNNFKNQDAIIQPGQKIVISKG
ncbi:MAG: transglycosylase SLT domain-containing protein [Gammaproteobacteria bacterium]|jgi:membrane-bound lytic murein transglycosylase D|nr:transglycosylase SLT domain-containing protein [Gammaproteobacteria bacterium]